MLNVTETIKNWSKRKLSEVFSFKYWQNWKPVDLGNGHFFFSNHIVKIKFFLLGHIFEFEFYIPPKIKKKQNFARFRVFDFGYRAKSKTREPRKFSFLFLKPNRDLLVFGHLSNSNVFIIVTCRFSYLEFLLVK